MLCVPRIIEPDEDELFASWLIRLASENVVSSTRTFIKTFIYPNMQDKLQSILRADYRIPFEHFWQALRFVHDRTVESDLFIRTSTFTGTAPFMRKEQRQRYLNRAFNTDRRFEPFFSQPHGTVNSLVICPECAMAELQGRGYYYLHRAHHLPGVTVCHIHGCPLSSLNVKYLNIDPCIIPEHTPLITGDTEMALRYARFSKDFMDNRFDYSLEDITSLILERKDANTANEMIKNGYGSISGNIEYFFKSQIGSVYITATTAMAALMYLYGNADALASSPWPDALEAQNTFHRDMREKGYRLTSDYRNDIVTLRHDACGKTFCTSPYGFGIGWRCPRCGKGATVQEKYRELISNIGNGEYEPLDEFESMQKKVSLRHSCGKTRVLRARAFIYEGTRCDCRWRIDFEAAKKAVEQYEGFTLLEYTRTDKPVKIRHTCGGEFEIYYSKFIATPRCRVCQRQGHLNKRLTDDLEKDIYDLTGSSYTLLDEYNGPRTPVRIRHNTCGSIQEYLPHRFLTGQRCQKCHTELTDQEFADYVAQYTLGRYAITERPTANLYSVLDTESGKKADMMKSRILQELHRPTQSPLLPLNKKNEHIEMRPARKGEAFLSYLKNSFGGGIIFTEDISYSIMTKEEIQTTLSNLAHGGKLQHLATGIYGFPAREYPTSEIIQAKYLFRNGKRIGFLRGESYAYLIGLAEKPKEWHIASKKESVKTPNRKMRFLGKDIHIKGIPEEIDNGNYLMLEAIDFLIQYHQCTDKPIEEVAEAIRKHLKASNNGILPNRGEFDSLVSGYKTANIRTMMARRLDLLFKGD